MRVKLRLSALSVDSISFKSLESRELSRKEVFAIALERKKRAKMMSFGSIMSFRKKKGKGKQ